MAELSVKILAPAQIVKQTKASQVQVPSCVGELGILPGHTAYVTELGTGTLEVMGSDGGKYEVSGGYLEVKDNQVTILADTIEAK